MFRRIYNLLRMASKMVALPVRAVLIEYSLKVDSQKRQYLINLFL